MKTIIKESKHCNYCDCIFTYEPEDIEQEQVFKNAFSNSPSTEIVTFNYVACPICNAKVMII